MKKYITYTDYIIFSCFIVFLVASQTIYPLLGDGDSKLWWAIDTAINRLSMFAVLLIVARLSLDSTLTVSAYIASVYYVLQLFYETAYIFNNNITIELYQVFLGLFAVMFAVAIGINIYLRSKYDR